MKRPWKIFLIVLVVILGLLIVVGVLVSIVLFNSRNLASVVRDQLNKQERLEFALSEADLVFFKTFPEVSLRIEGFSMADKSSSEELLTVKELYAALDLKRFLKENELIVRKISLENAHADITSLLKAFPGDTTAVETEEDTSAFSLPFGLMELSSFSASGLDLKYTVEGGMNAEVEGLDLTASLSANGMDVAGVLELSAKAVTLGIGDTLYCRELPFAAEIPFAADLDLMAFELGAAVLEISSFGLALSGKAGLYDGGAMDLDMDVSLGEWDISELLALLPEGLVALPDGLETVDGKLSLTANAKGMLADGNLPLLSGDLEVGELSLDKGLLPVDLREGRADVSFAADLNEGGKTDVDLRTLDVKTGKSSVSVKGKGNDLLGNSAFDAVLSAQIDFQDVMPLLPDSLNVVAEGDVRADLSLKGTLKQITENQFDRLLVDGELDFRGLDLTYNDTIFVESPDLNIGFALNGNHGYERSLYSDFAELVEPSCGVSIGFSSLDVMLGRALSAVITESQFRAALAQLPLGDAPLTLYCDYDMDGLQVVMDTLNVAVAAPRGTVALLPSLREVGQGRYLCNYDSDALYASLGGAMTVETGRIGIKASADRDSTAADILSQWLPSADVDFNEGRLEMAALDVPVEIPAIKFSYLGDTLRISEGSFVMGNSDFRLDGSVTDIRNFLFGEGLLAADLNFVSQNTDVDQLLGYFSGMGAEDADSTEVEGVEGQEDAASMEDESADKSETDVADSTAQEEGDPFMVPKGIDFTLNTKIASASAFNTIIENVGGEITVKDGVAVLRQLGFTSEAARMQLTAMYKSPRRNHLFAGIDFHLMDIEIDKLIQMIPQVDSIVPMLKSFAGQAEFHMAVETNLNSRYELKKSTLLGAATIEGQNLVVLDSETFDKIADLLMFKKSQKNVIDSLQVDMTVFRNEVDIYPFMLSMDKYKLILSGRHNLDMSFNYHLDCLSPVRLGLDVKGRLGDLKFNLTPTRYKNLFVPERRNDLQERTIKLMDMINSSLKETVVDQPLE